MLLYCERFVELLIDLQSQLPTRKYTNALILDLQVLVAVRLSSLYQDTKNSLFRDLVDQLEHYLYFAVNSYTSEPLSDNDIHERHCHELARLQRIALQHFKEKLTVLALSNYASIDKRTELVELLSGLDDEEVIQLCDLLHLRTSYPEGTNITVDRPFLIEVLVETFRRRQSFVEEARNLSIYPTEVPSYSHKANLEIPLRPTNPRIRKSKSNVPTPASSEAQLAISHYPRFSLSILRPIPL